MKYVQDQVKETYKDGSVTKDGETYNVKFDIKVEINEDIQTKDLKKGENIVTTDDCQGRGVTTSSSSGQNNISRVGEIGSITSVHEIGHQLGIVYRYISGPNADASGSNVSVSDDGYENSIMGADRCNL
ncbi:MAG: hypothetical protein ABWZ25_17595 [Chitinophagaceae bacterium]